MNPKTQKATRRYADRATRKNPQHGLRVTSPLERLVIGPSERKILAVLCESYPQSVDRESLSDATEYKTSSRNAYLQRLQSRKLVIVRGREVKAADTLFG